MTINSSNRDYSDRDYSDELSFDPIPGAYPSATSSVSTDTKERITRRVEGQDGRRQSQGRTSTAWAVPFQLRRQTRKPSPPPPPPPPPRIPRQKSEAPLIVDRHGIPTRISIKFPGRLQGRTTPDPRLTQMFGWAPSLREYDEGVSFRNPTYEEVRRERIRQAPRDQRDKTALIIDNAVLDMQEAQLGWMDDGFYPRPATACARPATARARPATARARPATARGTKKKKGKPKAKQVSFGNSTSPRSPRRRRSPRRPRAQEKRSRRIRDRIPTPYNSRRRKRRS